MLRLGEADEGLRTAIWNAILLGLTKRSSAMGVPLGTTALQVNRRLAADVLNKAVDEVPLANTEQWLKGIMRGAPWHVFYDVLEWMVIEPKIVSIADANSALTREGSAYGFLSGALAPITNEHEAESIE